MILHADVLLPISGPPIRDGVVEVTGNRFGFVGSYRELAPAKRRAAVDLGVVILLPGLVNAHCHLDYTHMAGQIPPPKLFTDWLKVMVSTKAGWSQDDYAASWKEGAQMLVRSGTTTVADMEAVPALLPNIWASTPLRVISYLEMISISRPAAEVFRETLEKARQLPGGSSRVGLSPHAPYTTVPELVRLTARQPRKHRFRVSTHLAESAAEFEMFSAASGEMFEWLKRSGRDTSDCGGRSPVQWLSDAGLPGSNLLAAHVNYLGRGDAALLSRKSVSVVHCPRSHFYFQHGPFPLKRLFRAGVNVCLGTDSLATVYQRRNEHALLDMFAEMRVLRVRERWLSPRRIIGMATINGARALGLQGCIGQISRGALADIIVVPASRKGKDPYATVLAREGPVLGSMIEGRWVVTPAECA